jgi:hypothetical protein
MMEKTIGSSPGPGSHQLPSSRFSRNGAHWNGVYGSSCKNSIRSPRPAMALATSARLWLQPYSTLDSTSLYDLPNRPEGRFDIVYTSFGAIHWLPDIEGQAEVIVDHFLAPGARF